MRGPPSLRSLARSVFDRMLAGERAVQAINHPLEFICIPVVRRPRFGVCGHIWSNVGTVPTIHSHSWDLYSEIALGAITNEVFRVSRQPSGDHQVIRVHSHGLADHLVATGTSVRVHDETTRTYQAGDFYTLGADTFHRSTPVTAGLTLTLIKATMLPGHHDQIVVRPPGPTGTTRRQLLTADAARSLVAVFRDAIEDERPEAG